MTDEQKLGFWKSQVKQGWPKYEMPEETTREFLNRVTPEVIQAVMPPGMKRQFVYYLAGPFDVPKKPKKIQVKKSKKEPGIAPHKRSMRCKCCDELSVGTTRHHLIPKQEGGTGTPTVRLCLKCHKSVHKLPNKQLAKMSQQEQFEYILSQ